MNKNECPYCGIVISQGEIEVEDSGISDDSYYYEITCPKCHVIFCQNYRLVGDNNFTLRDKDNNNGN